jgi:hypothetical protein
MQTKFFLEYALIANVFMCAAILGVFWRRHLFSVFSFMAAVVAVWAVEAAICLVTLYFRADVGMSRLTAYHWYMNSYWISSVLEHTLVLGVLRLCRRDCGYRASAPANGCRPYRVSRRSV